MNSFYGDFYSNDMLGYKKSSKPQILAPTVYLCEICGKSKANYNHDRCSRIKQQRFLNENKRMD